MLLKMAARQCCKTLLSILDCNAQSSGINTLSLPFKWYLQHFEPIHSYGFSLDVGAESVFTHFRGFSCKENPKFVRFHAHPMSF